jgi:hypothetical protein
VTASRSRFNLTARLQLVLAVGDHNLIGRQAAGDGAVIVLGDRHLDWAYFHRFVSNRWMLTNWLGQSSSPGLLNSAFNLAVPVVWSIWLSMVNNVPVASSV